MENIKALLDVLSKVGVCETGKRYLNGTAKDINVLIKVWKGWAEYLYEHSDFACKVLRKYLTEEDKKTLECESLFLDKVGRPNEFLKTPIFLVGDCDIEIDISPISFYKIYLFNKSKAKIHCGYDSIMDIEAFDESHVSIDGDTHRCTVYKYDKSTIEGSCKIKEKEYIRGAVFNGEEINSASHKD
jgi:hypothetical protein